MDSELGQPATGLPWRAMLEIVFVLFVGPLIIGVIVLAVARLAIVAPYVAAFFFGGLKKPKRGQP